MENENGFDETKYVFEKICNTVELEKYLEKTRFEPVISKFEIFKRMLRLKIHSSFLIDSNEEFIDNDGYKYYIKYYDNTIYHNSYKIISKRLWKLFRDQYLYPIVSNTFNKIQGYNIDFYRENPLEDSFNIAFNRFIQQEHKEIRNLLPNIYKCISKTDKQLDIEIFKENDDHANPPTECIKTSLHDIRIRLNKFFEKYLVLLRLTKIIKTIFLNNYESLMTDKKNNCVRETYSAVCGFHFSNAISLMKYSHKITKYAIDACEGKVSIFKNPSLLLDDTKDKTYTKYNQVLDKFNYIFDIIREMSRVSEYKNIDTFIDVDRLYKYNELINFDHGELCVAIDNYLDKYLTNGLKDNRLINCVYDEIRYKVQRYLDTLRFINKSGFIYSIKETIFYEKDCDTKQLLESFISKYGENADTLINDTEFFIYKAYTTIVKIIKQFIEITNTISSYVYEKLYSNGFNEINFDVIKDVRKRINSPTSISNELLLNKSNSFRDFFISY